jgi:hypothetical protein
MQNAVVDIMHLYRLFNVYNRDTKAIFKPINDLPGYVTEKTPVRTNFLLLYSFFFWPKDRVFSTREGGLPPDGF